MVRIHQAAGGVGGMASGFLKKVERVEQRATAFYVRMTNQILISEP